MKSSDWNEHFLRTHALPEHYRAAADAHFLPLVHWLATLRRQADGAMIVGINGAQGTGKTTLAAWMARAFQEVRALTAAVVSLDDFYLTRDARARLARDAHPLLATRGAPGTHDVAWLARCLDRLRHLEPGATVVLPRFDKATDDRAPKWQWRQIEGPVDVILFEGWLVGSRPVPEDALVSPINALERASDRDGRWRHYVNTRLATDYADLFTRIDRLVFLAAPDFDAVHRWRLEQERALARRVSGDAIMSDAEVAEFLEYFERITRDNLEHMPGVADAVLTLDAAHRCVAHQLRARPDTRPGAP